MRLRRRDTQRETVTDEDARDTVTHEEAGMLQLGKVQSHTGTLSPARRQACCRHRGTVSNEDAGGNGGLSQQATLNVHFNSLRKDRIG